MPLSIEAQGVVDRFTATLSEERHRHFDDTIRNSPGLQDEINAAVAGGRLRAFAPLPRGINAGAAFDYESGQLQLPLSMLDSPGRGRAFDGNELTFVLAHECRHATARPGVERAEQRFEQNIERIAQSADPVHDYTGPLRDVIETHRRDEGRAHIAGYNAVVSHLRQTNPHPTLEDIYRANPERMDQFIERSTSAPPTYALRPGLALGPDMSLQTDEKNAQWAGRHYFDRPASVANVGDHGLSDYTNLYAARYVGEIVQAERRAAPEHALQGRHPQMGMNMIDLRLDEQQLERNGLNLGPFGGSQPYLNTGQHPATECRFDHTIDTHRYVARADAPDAPHPAIQRAAEAIDRSPNIAPNDFGGDRDRVAAALAMHAAKENVRPDHVVMNDRGSSLIAVQGALGDPAAVLSSPLPLAKAQATDVSDAQGALQRLQPADAARQAALDQAPQREQPVLAASGPAR